MVAAGWLNKYTISKLLLVYQLSSINAREPSAAPPPRRRLARRDRHRQLLDVAWWVVRENGTDALTLGRLAEQAGVTKPVVYDHFGTRSGLLAALYHEYDARQSALLDAALAASAPTLAEQAAVIASSHIECVLSGGREITDVTAALAGSPELERVRRECEVAFMEKCRAVLAPFAGDGTITPADLRAMLGAAEALSHAAATGEINAVQAQDVLVATIIALVDRHQAGETLDA